MGKHMSAADDRAAYELHRRGWSNRKIGAHLNRNHRSIAAAIDRYKKNQSPSVPDEDHASYVRFLAWVEEGRRHGWDLKLLALMYSKKKGDQL